MIVEDATKKELEALAIETFLENCLLPQVAETVYADAVSKQGAFFLHKVQRTQARIKEEVAESLFDSLLEREFKLLLKNELEFEYFARVFLEQMLTN